MAFEKNFTLINDLLFQTVLSASSSLIIIFDADQSIISINPVAESCLNVSNLQACDQSLLSIFAAEDQDVIRTHLMVMHRSQAPHHFQLLLRKRLFTTILHPLLDQDELIGAVMIANDYTEQKRMEDDLYLTNQILSTVQNPMAILDDLENLKRVNDAFISVFAPDKGNIEGRPIAQIVGQEIYQGNLCNQLQQAREGKTVEAQDWYTLPQLGKQFLRTNIYPLFSGQQNLSGLVLHAVDLTEMKHLENKLHQLSITDGLTGLFNRSHFHTLFESEMLRSARYGIPLSFIMFDIDHFKMVNDTYGHDSGDEVLKRISEKVKMKIRETDVLFRWGGEEFILLLPHTTRDEAVVLAERIRLAIEHEPFERIQRVTCSFGATAFNGGESGSQLFKRLDELLYESKESGRNRVTAE